MQQAAIVDYYNNVPLDQILITYNIGKTTFYRWLSRRFRPLPRLTRRQYIR